MGKGKSMFQYADGVDKMLMLLGTIGCIGDGLQSALSMFILSDIINDYGGANNSVTNHIVDKVSPWPFLSVKCVQSSPNHC